MHNDYIVRVNNKGELFDFSADYVIDDLLINYNDIELWKKFSFSVKVCIDQYYYSQNIDTAFDFLTREMFIRTNNNHRIPLPMIYVFFQYMEQEKGMSYNQCAKKLFMTNIAMLFENQTSSAQYDEFKVSLKIDGQTTISTNVFIDDRSFVDRAAYQKVMMNKGNPAHTYDTITFMERCLKSSILTIYILPKLVLELAKIGRLDRDCFICGKWSVEAV